MENVLISISWARDLHGINLQYCRAVRGKVMWGKRTGDARTLAVLAFSVPFIQGASDGHTQTMSLHWNWDGRDSPPATISSHPFQRLQDQQSLFPRLPIVPPPRHLVWWGGTSFGPEPPLFFPISLFFPNFTYMDCAHIHPCNPPVHLLSFLQELHRLKYERSERNHSCRRVTRNNWLAIIRVEH